MSRIPATPRIFLSPDIAEIRLSPGLPSPAPERFEAGRDIEDEEEREKQGVREFLPRAAKTSPNRVVVARVKKDLPAAQGGISKGEFKLIEREAKEEIAATVSDTVRHNSRIRAKLAKRGARKDPKHKSPPHKRGGGPLQSRKRARPAAPVAADKSDTESEVESSVSSRATKVPKRRSAFSAAIRAAPGKSSPTGPDRVLEKGFAGSLLVSSPLATRDRRVSESVAAFENTGKPVGRAGVPLPEASRNAVIAALVDIWESQIKGDVTVGYRDTAFRADSATFAAFRAVPADDGSTP
jgi:hypothetical protein